MTVNQCDRCGKQQIERLHQVQAYSFTYPNVREICSKCMKELEAFMKGKQ